MGISCDSSRTRGSADREEKLLSRERRGETEWQGTIYRSASRLRSRRGAMPGICHRTRQERGYYASARTYFHAREKEKRNRRIKGKGRNVRSDERKPERKRGSDAMVDEKEEKLKRRVDSTSEGF